MKRSEPVAVRFFFADATDARDLFDLLAVPEGEREAYVHDANSLLSPEERPLRAIVDLSDSVEGKALVEICEELANKIVLAIPERVALVVTESQRQYLLPRCTPEGHVQIEVVSNAEQGWVRTQKLAADGAIVISGRRFDPLSRSIAFETNGRRFTLEPSDGTTRCAAGKPVDDADANVSPRRLDVLFGNVVASQPGVELHGVLAIVLPRIVRESALGALQQTWGSRAFDEQDYYESRRKQRRFLLPKSSVIEDFDEVFDLFDHSPAKTGYTKNNHT